MQEVTKTYQVYSFDELTPKVQAKVLDRMRADSLEDGWYHNVYEDARRCGQRMGITINDIYFTLHVQGSGAQFVGEYQHLRGIDSPTDYPNVYERIKQHAPQDEELQRVGERLQAIQEANDFAIAAKVKSEGRGCASYNTSIEVWDMRDGRQGDINEDVDSATQKALRSFMDWIYDQLNKKYDYLTSDEYYKEEIANNEYQYLIDGTKFDE